MRYKNFLFLIIIILLLVSLYFVLIKKQESRISQETKLDTLTIIHQRPPIQIKKSRGKLNFRNTDTVKFSPNLFEEDSIQSPKLFSFISELDTIINGDTLNIKYTFPENEFDIDFRFNIDTSKTYIITLQESQLNPCILAFIIIGTLMVGILAGSNL